MPGRKKLFNEEEVLEKAAYFFWKNGYAKSDARSLAKEINLNPGSIYHTFCSKKGLFIRSFEHLSSKMEDETRRIIYGPENIKLGIRNLFLGMTKSENRNHAGRGCHLGNTLVEVDDKDINEVVRHALKKWKDLLREAIEKGQEMGQISPEKDPSLLADYLMNLWHGLNISRRTNEDPMKLTAMIEFSLAVLD